MTRKSKRLQEKAHQPDPKDTSNSEGKDRAAHKNSSGENSAELLSRKKKEKSSTRQKAPHPKAQLEDELTEALDFSDGLQAAKSPTAAKQKAASPATKAPAALGEKLFDADDQMALCEDEYKRFLFPSKQIGHALIRQNPDGSYSASQYAAPGVDDPQQPEVVHLNDIQLVHRYGALRAIATTDSGTNMVSKRSVQVGTNVGEQYAQNRLYMFSPESSHQWKGNVFWGSDETKQPPFFRDDLDDGSKADLDEELAELEPVTKGGRLEIVHQDVPVRDGMDRKPDQNGVMGDSAMNAYEDFFNSYKDELSADQKAIMQKSIDARPFWRGGGFKSQPRPEWLHAKGFGLTPLSMNPQQKDNLASAPKWVNTTMMIVERTLKWHAEHRPDSTLILDVKFDMLFDSELMQKGYIQGEIEEYGNMVTLKIDLNPFAKHPSYPKTTDIMQTTMVTQGILHQNAALESAVTVEPMAASRVPAAIKHGAGASITSKPSKLKSKEGSMPHTKTKKAPPKPLTDSTDSLSGLLSEDMEADTPAPSARPRRRGVIEDDSDDVSEDFIDVDELSDAVDATQVADQGLGLSDTKTESESEVISPTKHSNEKSVVQIYSTFQPEDYETPWKGTEPMTCTGSGFVYEHEGKKYLLTNAHVVESSNYLEVRLANDAKRYKATPLQVSYQADIAILEVSDPAFQKKVVPVTLGDMVKNEQEVKVVGFPMGGDEVSTTRGIISRIQVDEYVEGGERNLQAQTDSAINPGNSGGPVFSGNKLVGIAFQGIGEGDGLGYIIPIPVVQHFLKDYFSPESYQGFPSLNIAFQTLSNDTLREALGMNKKQSGIRVTRVDALSDASGKLKEGDIITAIDGINVSNDGKVDVPRIGERIELNYLFSSKYIGDTTRLSVLRENKHGKLESKQIDVTLKYRAAGTKIIEGYEFEKPPTYYATAGMLFQPVTMNYLETGHGHQLREMVVSNYGYLSDVPKKEAGQQLVVINRIFASEHTKGYDFFENNAVKSINGQAISNMKDLVRAFEANPKSHHRVEVASGEIIAVKNLGYEEDKALFRRYRINNLCSDDLKPELLRKVGKDKDSRPVKAMQSTSNDLMTHQEANQLREQMARLMAMLDGGAGAGISAGAQDTRRPSRPVHLDLSVTEADDASEEILSDEALSSDGSDDYDSDDSFIVEDELEIAAAPVIAISGAGGAVGDGRNHYLARIADMEKRYGAARRRGKQEEGELTDDESTDEDFTDVSESESELGSSSANDATPPASPQPRRSSRLRGKRA